MTAKSFFPSRAVQLEILQGLRACYPAMADVQQWKHANLAAELYYLNEHGLANVSFSKALGQPIPKPISARLTAKGIDFLQDDGGLSAILGVVTIKLDDDTIKKMIKAKIIDSDLPQPDKSRYLDALRELPGETTKHLVLKLVDMGLDHKDAAISAIGKLLGLG